MRMGAESFARHRALPDEDSARAQEDTMFRPLHRSRIIALASVTLAACHDAPDHELLERAAPLADGADADADADGQQPGDPESGDPESDDAPIEDLIARQDPETQTLYVLDGFQDTVSDALGLIWV